MGKILHGGDYNPEQWFYRPETLEEDILFFKEANINTITLGIFSWSIYEPKEGEINLEYLEKIINKFKENGIKTILATPSGGKPGWLAKKYPEVCRVNEYGQRQGQGFRHNHCWSSEVFREKIKIINTALAKKFGNHPAILMWHISNEYSGECHCETCQNKFREWLKKKYKTIENLNLKWWNTFWSHNYSNFEEITSPSPLREYSSMMLSLEWKIFTTDLTIDFYKFEEEILKKHSNKTCTTNFFGKTKDQMDFHKFAKEVDQVSYDIYPLWHLEELSKTASESAFTYDLNNSSGKNYGFTLMECTPSTTNWFPYSKQKEPGLHELASIQAIAHGSNSILYFQLRQSRGSYEKFHGAVIDHNTTNKSRVFKEVSKLGKNLSTISEIYNSKKIAEVAIIYDPITKLSLDLSKGPSNDGHRYNDVVNKYYNQCLKYNINIDIINTTYSLEKYKVILLPMTYRLSIDEIKKLKNFVLNGGTLISSFLLSYTNEYDLIYHGGLPSDLQDIFGCNIKELDVQMPSNNNYILYKNNKYKTKHYYELLIPLKGITEATYNSDYFSGEAAIIKNKLGKGDSIYIGTDIEDKLLEKLIFDKLKEKNVIKILDVNLPKNVYITQRSVNNTKYYFILNFSENLQQIELPKKLYNLLNNKKEQNIVLEKHGFKILKESN